MKNKHFFQSTPTKKAKKAKQKGFTLIEVLIVVSILMLLILLVFFTSFRQLSKGRDSRRKTDLEKIKVSFEDYYNDNNCYPDPSVLNNCDGDTFRPYLDTIPCDPQSREPYIYLSSEGGLCKGYKLLARLENIDDPVIVTIGCNGETGCGYIDDPSYNYGISQGMGVTEPGVSGDYTGSTPEYSDDYYCLPEAPPQPGCSYMQHENAEERNCPIVFDGPTNVEDCQAVCRADNPSVICDEIEE